MSSISLAHVSKWYGQVCVVEDFNCVFQHQEFVTLLGPSGCGKTTLLRMIAGFEKPSSGSISIGERIVSGPKSFVAPEERGIGMVFQSYAVWPHMNVFENVSYPLKIRRVEAAARAKRVEEILEVMGLADFGQRMPNELSGGQQQRVALGRALASSSQVLLLDEPLSNLDAKLRESMRFEIKEMQKRFGLTVIYVTHDQTEAMAMSDRVIVLKDGRIQQVDSPSTLYRAPANVFVAGFVGKISCLPAQAVAGKIVFSGGQSLAYTGEKRGSVLLAIRPENIRLRLDQGILPGVLTHAQYLGDITDVRVAVPVSDSETTHVRLTAPGRSVDQIAPGTSVWLDFDDYLIFDREEEASITI
ncbi:MAG: ABC transporter ATP-binding protein [Desulfovibrio sp.]|nr:ABC transporter ATP-binding protein [Desulfovibrio sp.]